MAQSPMHTQQTILLSMLNTAESITRLIQPTLSNEIPKVVPDICNNISIPVLDLPFPASSDFDAILKTLGLSERGYCEVYCKIQKWVHNLQTAHSLYFQRSCHSLASLPHFQSRRALDTAIEQLRLTYQKKYTSCLPSIKQMLSTQSMRNSTCKNTKTPFNDEYTPLLELYFEQNAYPSLPDRQLLAKKSMMTMRQIEVWFQNHRARARKEGKVIKKLHRPCQPQLNLEPFNETVPFPSSTDSTIKPSIDNELGSDASSGDETYVTSPPFASFSFSQVAPAHSFPTTYPPNLVTDPFPNENGIFKFPPPIWMRTSTQPKVQPTDLDMDEFISMFGSKLHLRDGSRRKCDAQHSQNTRRHKKPWFASMVVTPASAPHPALIRAASGTVIPHSNSSTPSNSPFTSSPLSLSPNPPKPRKFAPFSKRAPSVLSANHTSDGSTAFSVFASRTSSLSSIASSQRSSSLSSISSAEPATPPLSPIRQHDPLFADYDCQLLDELFGPDPSQPFHNTSCTTHDFLFPTISLKDVSNNPLYDLSSILPPIVAQVHC